MGDPNYEAREAKIIAEIKAGATPSPDVAKRFVTAKTQLKLGVMADTFGGLMGADAIGSDTMKRGDEYENALQALEVEVGIS